MKAIPMHCQKMIKIHINNNSTVMSIDWKKFSYTFFEKGMRVGEMIYSPVESNSVLKLDRIVLNFFYLYLISN
jgi:hypothetical protein